MRATLLRQHRAIHMILLFKKIIESRLSAQFYHMLSKLAPRLNKVDIKIESYWI